MGIDKNIKAYVYVSKYDERAASHLIEFITCCYVLTVSVRVLTGMYADNEYQKRKNNENKWKGVSDRNDIYICNIYWLSSFNTSAHT